MNAEEKLKEWVVDFFPQLESRIPEKPVFMKSGSREMLSSHDLPLLSEWLISGGIPKFMGNSQVPNGFFACGIASPASSESLLVMWREGNRYFWLYDRYALYIVKDSINSIARTQGNLDRALKLWDEGEQYVIFLMGSFLKYPY